MYPIQLPRRGGVMMDPSPRPATLSEFVISNNLSGIACAIAVTVALLILGPINVIAGCSVPSFRASSHFPAGTQAQDVVTGDFNRDGNLDLAVASQGIDVVSILYGNGLGGFVGPINFPANDGPIGLTAGDVNLDGAADLVVANFLSDDISILLNNGSGVFSSPTNIAVGNQPETIAIADFNGDGKPDIAVNRLSGATIAVLLGNGNGTFGTPTTFSLAPTVGQGRTIRATDLDFDGDIDLLLNAANNLNQGVLVVMHNNGAGAFTFITALSINVGLARDLEVGDLNRDGRPDAVIGSTFGAAGTGGISVLLGNGSGSLTFAGNLLINDTVDSVAIDDINGDGKPDVLGALELGRKVVVFLGNGAGGASAGPFNFTFAPTSTGFLGISTGDFNSDGRVDFATSSATLGDVAVGLGTCGGGATRPQVDFDGDGKTDVAVFRPSNGFWFILKSSNNTFQFTLWGQNGDIPATGDYDGDGRSDFAVFRPVGGNWFILQSSNGAFVARQFGQNGDQPASGDYDGDGLSDIAVFRPSIGTWFILQSLDGQFRAQQWGQNGDVIIH